MTNKALTELLDKDVADVKRWEVNRFDSWAGEAGAQRLVLYGAGELGQKTLEGLRVAGVEPLAFCDSNPALIGQRVGGLDVLSPSEAAERFGKTAVFVVTVFMKGGSIREKLLAAGCEKVLPFYPLFWKHGDRLLPHYSYDLPHKILEARDEILAAEALLADEASKSEFLAQVKWRLDPESVAPTPPETHPIYFAPDIIALSDEEVFVDCGGFTGDTVQALLRATRSRFRKAIVLEPEPHNLDRLHKWLATLAPDVRGRIEVLPVAVSDGPGTVRFSTRSAASAFSGNGDLEVSCRALDEILAGSQSSFLKMDVEGAEMLALEGAREHIRTYRPKLAISAYHRQDHLWKIPLFINALNVGYRFYYRRYNPEFLDDLVLYAITSP